MRIRDDAVVSLFISWHRCCLGLALRHTWVEFVVGFRLTSSVFLRILQFDQERGPAWNPAKAGVANSLNIVIYFYWYMTYFCTGSMC